ncbi:MAG: exodeoxyribonuclease III [Legionellaceae bacterium]|nr:exodeoxyribonuclease III [Legionellaceae bacterium]
MRVISFNANGVRAAARRGFYDWLAEQQADFVCIQETKASPEQLTPSSLFFPEGYHCEYVAAEKKGYSGVAIYARHAPQSIVKSIGYDVSDREGRYLQFDYPKFSIVSLYLPSGTSGDQRQTVKFAFLERFAQHLQELKNAGRELILCGDYNIAHQTIDIKNWRSNQKSSGFLPEERAWLDQLFGTMGFRDAFRVLNQEAEQYTWWSYRARAFAKNVGWRIDYQVITPGLVESLRSTHIYRETQFSDHAPLIMDYEVKAYA